MVCITQKLKCLQSSWSIFLSQSSSLSSVLRGSNSTDISLGTTIGGNHPRTDADCIRNILDLLSHVEYDFQCTRVLRFTEHGCRRMQSEKILTDSSVMKSIICRTTDFTIAIVCGIERAQSMLSAARTIQSSGNAHELHTFAGDLQLALMKTQGNMSHAQSGIDVSLWL